MRKFLIALSCCSVLSGCVGDFSVSPEVSRSILEQGVASIQFNRNVTTKAWGGQDFSSFIVERVEGPPSSATKPVSISDNIIPLTPGTNTLTVKAFDMVSFLGGYKQRNGSAVITFLAAPETAYVLQGYVLGDTAKVWIGEKNTMRHVTEEIEMTMSAEEVKKFEPVPIIIPGVNIKG